MKPLHGRVVSKYLVRVWPVGSEPPEMQQSELWCPESISEGEDGNDRALLRAVRGWAQGNADVDQVRYSFEVCRDSLVAALAGSSSSRVVAQIGSGTVEPGDVTRQPRPR